MNTSKFESFNARNLTPEEVAVTFIPNKDYVDLWNNDHTVVLGPRGSGKTTLFKMLTVQALYSWDSEFAHNLRDARPFTAIYVPTDMHWHHQLVHGEERMSSAPKMREAISRCAVTTSILLATVRTFQARIHHEAVSDLESEAVVAKMLIKEWRLDQTLPTFEMVALALKSRISQIRALVNEFSLRGESTDAVELLPSYYHLDYFSTVDVGCAAFDAAFHLHQSTRWALCFDEMELAPEWLQTLVMSQIRSSDQGFLIKVSTSPIPTVSGRTDARPKQDYHLISIWNHSGRDSQAFSLQLAGSVLERKFGSGVTPLTLMGSSTVIASGDTDAAKYERGSEEWKMFREQATWDDSFRALLEDEHLDPSDPVTDDIGLRDAVLRKAKPIVMFRSAFLKKGAGGKLRFRSRKVPGVYFGMDAIVKICDANPRRLIGVINDLAARVRFNANGMPISLSENEQDQVLSNASAQFLGYVNALPGGMATLGQERLDLATMLKAIASYFRSTLLGQDFVLDPKGSFIVDSHLNRQVVELIRLGVYHGAIVHIDPLPDTIETSVVGKRFRLSYMLAPTLRLPLNLYGEISLTAILRSSPRARLKRAARLLEQVELPHLLNT